MPFLRRRIGFSLLVLVILAVPFTALAQEDAIRIDGSRIVADLIAPVSEALETSINLEISGTSNGLARLCSGEIDIANAARAITREEIEACAANEIEWVEALIGYDALAVISNPAITTAQCMTFNELTTLFGPGATGTVSALNQVNPVWGTGAVQAYAPAADAPAYNLLDSLLPGDGLRSDFTTEADASALVAAVAENAEAVGFTALAAALDTEAAVNLVGLDNLSGGGCVTPDAATLADGTYPAANGLYLYVNAASLEREDVQALVSGMVDEQGQAAVADAGFVTLSSEQAARVADNAAEGVTGRQFSQAEPLYAIPLDVAGTVALESAAEAASALNSLTAAFTGSYAGVTVNTSSFGNAAAYRDLCSGAADAAAVTRPATAEEAAACEASGVSLWEAQLGARGLVMVVGQDAEYAACLTTEQVADLWKAEDGVALANWQELGADFPDLPITVFLPLNSQNATDFLLTSVSDTLYDARRDALEQRNDTLWRAAATANVEGAVTYMTLAQFEAADADVMAVAVDSGEGCVAPTTETILDGSYAISQPVTLVVRQDALARPEVQALAWYAVRNGASVLNNTAVTPVSSEAFTAYQEALVPVFASAEEAAASAPAAEPTEEPAAEEQPAAEESATEESAEEEQPAAEEQPATEPTTEGSSN